MPEATTWAAWIFQRFLEQQGSNRTAQASPRMKAACSPYWRSCFLALRTGFPRFMGRFAFKPEVERKREGSTGARRGFGSAGV